MTGSKELALQKDWELDVDRGLPVSRITVELRWVRITRELASFIRKYCQKGGLILDIGAGDGSLYHLISDTAGLYTGIEPSDNMLRQFIKAEHANACKAYGEELPFKKDIFDAVIFNSSLDHCLDPLSALSEANRVLKKNGKVFILLSNDSSWYKNFFKIYNNKRKKMTKEHNYFFSKKDITTFLEKKSFKKISIFQFDFLRFPISIENYLIKHISFKILSFMLELSDSVMRSISFLQGGTIIFIGVKR